MPSNRANAKLTRDARRAFPPMRLPRTTRGIGHSAAVPSGWHIAVEPGRRGATAGRADMPRQGAFGLSSIMAS